MARILVVEDDSTLLEILRLHLTARGHLVECACDAVEAMEALLQAEFNLVLTDLTMPRMSGIELIRSVRRDSRTAQVALICLTVHTDAKNCMEATRAGADGYLTKPVTAEDLAHEIERALALAAKRQLKPGLKLFA